MGNVFFARIAMVESEPFVATAAWAELINAFTSATRAGSFSIEGSSAPAWRHTLLNIACRSADDAFCDDWRMNPYESPIALTNSAFAIDGSEISGYISLPYICSAACSASCTRISSSVPIAAHVSVVGFAVSVLVVTYRAGLVDVNTVLNGSVPLIIVFGSIAPSWMS
ncbi:hypothetical protein WL99_19920 [Burkholderia cepacia]|nr:hypothetical protein WL99_19920 [Burkholderia cepacia]